MGINKYSGTKITLGSSWIVGHDIVFDRKKKLIGIAEANCSINEEINKTSGLELIKDDYRLKINITNNSSNIIGNKSYHNHKNVNISSNKSMDQFKNVEIWRYIILAIVLFIFLIIIIIIICCKYLKKNDMTQMDIENEGNNNIGNINNKSDENEKKDSSYKKIATEAESKEQRDNKDNQPEIVIESV